MLHDELRQEVPELWCLGPIRARVVLNSLGPSNVVNPYDKGSDVRVFHLRAEVQPQQTKREERNQKQRDLQVGVHHQRGAVQLHELLFRVLECLRVEVGNSRGHLCSLPKWMEMQN